MALGYQLGADDEVEFAPRRGVERRRKVSIPPGKSDDSTSVRASGKTSAASSATRSTPGPQAVRLSASRHCGQVSAGGSTWPQWWQTSAARKRCSTSQAEQLGQSICGRRLGTASAAHSRAG